MVDIIKDIIDYIDNNNVNDIYDLLSLCITDNKKVSWNKVLQDDKLLSLFDSYIKKVRSERNLQLIRKFYLEIQKCI